MSFATAALQGALERRHAKLEESDDSGSEKEIELSPPHGSGDPHAALQGGSPAGGPAVDGEAAAATSEDGAGGGGYAAAASAPRAPGVPPAGAAGHSAGGGLGSDAAPLPQVIGAAEQQAPQSVKRMGQLSEEEEASYTHQAKLVSQVSILISLLVGFIGVSTFLRDKDLSMLGLGGESLLDAISSALVLWRFKTPKGRTFEDAVAAAEFKALRNARRERRSALGIGVAFIALAVLLFTLSAKHMWEAGEATPDELLYEEDGMGTGLMVAVPSIGVFALLAWYKDFLSEELNSEVLKQDAKCTAFGAVLALITAASALLEELFSHSDMDSVAFGLVDPLAAGCIAALIFRDGAHTIRENLPEVTRESAGLSDSPRNAAV